MKYLIFSFLHSGVEALSSATQHVMPPKFGGKWGGQCLNTRLPLPTLLREVYSVKPKKKKVKDSSYAFCHVVREVCQTAEKLEGFFQYLILI